MIRIHTFPWAPVFIETLLRDFRVRWALEEAGQTYEVVPVTRQDAKLEAYRALQPFGQVPVYEEDGLVLFESGAILMHIGEHCEALLPKPEKKRARAIMWMFASLNSVEPPLQHLLDIDYFTKPGTEWAVLRRDSAVENVKRRLSALETYLMGREYLEDAFTAGDLLMTTVLRIIRHTDILKDYPNVERLRARCEGRPAFKKALADQLAMFAAHAHLAPQPKA